MELGLPFLLYHIAFPVRLSCVSAVVTSFRWKGEYCCFLCPHGHPIEDVVDLLSQMWPGMVAHSRLTVLSWLLCPSFRH